MSFTLLSVLLCSAGSMQADMPVAKSLANPEPGDLILKLAERYALAREASSLKATVVQEGWSPGISMHSRI